VGPEELLGTPCQLQQSDPLLDVVLVRLFVALDPGQDPGLLLTRGRDVRAAVCLLDLSAQLVRVDLVDTVLELGILGVQLLDGAAVVLCLLLLTPPSASGNWSSPRVASNCRSSSSSRTHCPPQSRLSKVQWYQTYLFSLISAVMAQPQAAHRRRPV
jgi:hypothetical protein